ncbi:YbbR-like domain-containing protein [Candidatus Omnitrophota bacterium]
MSSKVKRNKLLIVALSFVLAVGLWAYITNDQSTEVSVEVALNVSTPEGLTVVNKSQDTVTIILSVPRNIAYLLERQPAHVTHVIADVDEVGKYSFYLKPQDVKRPSGLIKVQQIIPERIIVTLDKVINKRLPILPQLINEPAAGYKVNKDTLQIDPNAVLVSGAQSVLDKINSIYTQPIDTIGRIRSFRKKVSLEESPDYTIMNPGLIDVFVPLFEAFAQKEFKDVRIKLLNAPKKNYDVRLTPEKVTFSLRGPGQIIEGLDQEKILAYVDVVQLEVGKYKLPLQLNLPSGVALSETVPVVDVIIGDAESQRAVPTSVIPSESVIRKDSEKK